MTLPLLVNIDVDDLHKAIAFYQSALGLRIGRMFGDQAAEMLGASSPIYLLLKQPGSAASTSTEQHRDYRRHWTPVHLDVVVADIEAAVRQAEAAGATCEDPIRAQVWGRIAHLADPFGHGFCLIQFLGQGYDEIASG